MGLVEIVTENLTTVLELTEGKPRPAFFSNMIGRLEDTEDAETKGIYVLEYT